MYERGQWTPALVKLRSIIDAASVDELRVMENELRSLLSRYPLNIRQPLLLVLDAKVRTPSPDSHLRSETRHQLADLADHHLFQWATFYRDNLWDLFKEYLRACQASADPAGLLTGLEEELIDHARTIFHRGDLYQKQTRDRPGDGSSQIAQRA